eukprot:m.814265 g.814265  ORF g.814265 m.814265 type:complete len:384 (+) comp59365_c0_seq17:1423-2574(+)
MDVCHVSIGQAAIYFTARKDSILETHLYRVQATAGLQEFLEHDPVSSMAAVATVPWSEPQRLTELGFSHAIAINSDGSKFATTYSSLSSPTAVALYNLITGAGAEPAVEARLQGLLCQKAECAFYIPPQPFEFQTTDGVTLHGLAYRPPAECTSVNGATVLYVYAGPGVQLVTNEHKAARLLRMHMLSLAGFNVIVLDSRGSSNRGAEFESILFRSMGRVELPDQIAGLHHVADSGLVAIDFKRVAIFGWSYGGYMSLMGLAQHPDVFKIAVAGAPVTEWSLYDTGYTERYMDTPANNPGGYQRGSVLSLVQNFPNEENRLLIVHGLNDENVHFTHTAQLLQKLILAGKPHRVQVYPGERHGLKLAAAVHFETSLIMFLRTHL